MKNNSNSEWKEGNKFKKREREEEINKRRNNKMDKEERKRKDRYEQIKQKITCIRNKTKKNS